MSEIPRIVYLCPEAPWPVTTGGRFRVDAVHRALSAIGPVPLIVVGDKPDRELRLRIRAEGGSIHPSRREGPAGRLLRILTAAARGRSIPAERYRSPRRLAKLASRLSQLKPDLVVLGDAYLGAAFIDVARAHARAVVIDTHDAASLVSRRIAAASPRVHEKIGYRLLARNTFAMERRIFPRADQLWTLSEADAGYYRRVHHLGNLAIVPNPIALPAPARAVEEPLSVVFVGSFSYWPNEDAALRLIAMAQGLRRRGALDKLYLVGVAPTARMRKAAAGDPGIVVTGRVPEVGPFLDRAALVAVPLAAGSGLKVKILEAMARARPVLTTQFGAEGLDIVSGVQAEIAPLGSFADAVAALMGDPARRRELAIHGRRMVEERHSPAAMESQVRALVARALAPR